VTEDTAVTDNESDSEAYLTAVQDEMKCVRRPQELPKEADLTTLKEYTVNRMSTMFADPYQPCPCEQLHQSSFVIFRRQLKTFLFNISFPDN